KIKQLNKGHDRKKFDCGQSEINKFLKLQANQSAKKSYSQTHVLIDENKPIQIIGFYTLTSILINKPLQHQINIKYPHELFGVNLARMGVDINFQKQSLSSHLIIDAIEKTTIIEQNMGCQGLFVDAKNEKLIQYYKKFGFETISDTSYRMWLPIGTINKLAKF
ncbi:MAG: hypothetical protein AB8B80_11405, partial [Marinicellaceae bacterium]